MSKIKKRKVGRPKLKASEKKEPTKVIRVRVSKLEAILKINSEE